MTSKKVNRDPWRYYEAAAARVAAVVGDADIARDATLRAVEWCLRTKPPRITLAFLTRRALWRALDILRQRALRGDVEVPEEDADRYPADELSVEQLADLAAVELPWSELVSMGRDIAGLGAVSREDGNAHRCARYRARKKLKEVL